MNPSDKQRLVKDFSKLVDEILCYIWDPLQVSIEFLPNTRSEYSMYVGKICSIVISGASQEELTYHLDKIIIERMEQESMQEKCAMVSSLIFKCYEFLLDEPEMAHSVLTNYERSVAEENK